MSTFNETITLTNVMDDVRVEAGILKEVRSVTLLADGTTAGYAMTEPVEIRWKNRTFALPAEVVPTVDAILLGVLVMEVLDVIADPVDECLKGRHGDKPLYWLKSVRRARLNAVV